MNTRENILSAALQLFNERGTDVVTVRQIAQEVGISHGNLCYHFPNTDALISRLYDQLVERLSQRIETVVSSDVSLPILVTLTRQTLTTLHEYRFLMLDFAGIMRRLPDLREKHRALVKERQVVFRQFFSQLRTQALIRAEIYPGHDEDVLEQFFIVGDFWLASATILYEGPAEQQLIHYLRVFLALIVPLLTEKGLQEWQAMSERAQPII